MTKKSSGSKTSRPLIKWKTIKNYPNYQISTNGEIRNKQNKRILAQQIKGDYKTICLNRKQLRINILMGITFL